MERAAIAAPSTGSALFAPRKALRLLDFLEHLEDAFRRSDEKALVGLAEATTLEGVPAGSGSFCHGITSLSCNSKPSFYQHRPASRKGRAARVQR
jgi:hypothetical protein